jgi:hypothetical protein
MAFLIASDNFSRIGGGVLAGARNPFRAVIINIAPDLVEHADIASLKVRAGRQDNISKSGLTVPPAVLGDNTFEFGALEGLDPFIGLSHGTNK